MDNHKEKLRSRLVKLLQDPPKDDDHLKGWGNECLQVMCQLYGSILHEEFTLPYTTERRIPVNQTRTQDDGIKTADWSAKLDRSNKVTSKPSKEKKGHAKVNKGRTQKTTGTGRGKPKL